MRRAPLAIAVCVLACAVLLGVTPAGAHQAQISFQAGVWLGDGHFTYTGPAASGRGVYEFFMRINARGNVVPVAPGVPSVMVVTAAAWANLGELGGSGSGYADIPMGGTAVEPTFDGALAFPIVISAADGSSYTIDFVMPMEGSLKVFRGNSCRKLGGVVRVAGAGGAIWEEDRWGAIRLSRSCPLD